MKRTEALRRLRTLGTAQNRKVYARHGVGKNQFGVSFADLNALKREIGVDQDLADALWASGIHDARVLAAMVADPAEMSARKLGAWVGDLDNYVVTDAFSTLAAASPAGPGLVQRWIRSRGEWVSSAGWSVLSQLVKNGEAPAKKDLGKLLVEIETRIAQAPNRARYAMNAALISIGLVDGLRDRAVAVARRVSPVEVDHGETGCKTPDAEAHIEKALARRDGRRHKA